MKKILVALMLVSTVMAMSMPGMADPRADITKTVHNAETATNAANSAVSQALDNSGAQSNIAVVLAAGGSATALTEADAHGMATNSGNAKVMEGSGSANAGNLGSGNAAAVSGAIAMGGDGENGNVDQSNLVVQTAIAELDTLQGVGQSISEFELLSPIVHVSDSIFDNTMGSDNLIEIGCPVCDE